MLEDGNDFMGSSFSNYDTTENKMSDGGSGGTHSGGNTKEKKIAVLGTIVETGRICVGLAVLIIGTIIGLAVGGEQETALECFAGASVFFCSIIVSFVIWLKK